MNKKITKYNNKISKKSKFHDLYVQDIGYLIAIFYFHFVT